jgi:hypothetical protein
MEQDLYCKVYVDSNLESSDFLASIADVIKGNVSLRTVSNDLLEVSVFSNKDYDRIRSGEVDGFVFYPYYLEIEPIDEVTVNSEVYKMSIDNLLKVLWGMGADAVAACDFEDELQKKIAS